MKSQKTILHLHGQYVHNISELKTLMSNTRLVHDETFRSEMLAAYRDSILESWYVQNHATLSMIHKLTDKQDNELFIELYKAITGDTPSFNLNSSFAKYGELVRCELNGNVCTIDNGLVFLSLNNDAATSVLNLVFRCIGPENNTHILSLYNAEGTMLCNVDCDWSDKVKGKEYSISFVIDTSFKCREIFLKECTKGMSGDPDNQIVKFIIEIPPIVYLRKKNREYKFYYIKSENYYVGKVFESKCQYKSLREIISRNSRLDLSLPTVHEMRVWLKQVYTRGLMPQYFWVKDGIDGVYYYDGDRALKTVECDENYAWLICRNLLNYSIFDSNENKWVCNIETQCN